MQTRVRIPVDVCGLGCDGSPRVHAAGVLNPLHDDGCRGIVIALPSRCMQIMGSGSAGRTRVRAQASGLVLRNFRYAENKGGRAIPGF